MRNDVNSKLSIPDIHKHLKIEESLAALREDKFEEITNFIFYQFTNFEEGLEFKRGLGMYTVNLEIPYSSKYMAPLAIGIVHGLIEKAKEEGLDVQTIAEITEEFFQILRNKIEALLSTLEGLVKRKLFAVNIREFSENISKFIVALSKIGFAVSETEGYQQRVKEYLEIDKLINEAEIPCNYLDIDAGVNYQFERTEEDKLGKIAILESLGVARNTILRLRDDIAKMVKAQIGYVLRGSIRCLHEYEDRDIVAKISEILNLADRAEKEINDQTLRNLIEAYPKGNFIGIK